MNRDTRMKRLRRNPVFLILSFVFLMGWVTALGAAIGAGAYDMVTLEGCVKGLTQAEEDYVIAYKHIPPTADPKQEATYVEEIERTFEDRVEALWCPFSMKDEQAAFVAANRRFTVLIHTVTIYGVPQDEFAREILWQQLRSSGNRALEAWRALGEAALAEAERQHPPKANQAPVAP